MTCPTYTRLVSFRLAALAVLASLAAGSSPALANYQKAKKLFVAEKFASAANEYYKAYVRPRSAAEKNKSEYGIAASLARLGLPFAASKYLSKIVRRGPSTQNPFFRPAMEELGRINNRVSLGPAHIIQLFRSNIRSSEVPGPARGFYFYYLGIEKFQQKRWQKARFFFSKVPSSSSYYIGALFHIAVVTNLSGSHSRAISLFDRVFQLTQGRKKYVEINHLALMNLARIHYETRRYREAIEYYSQVPRNSDQWLTAIWEASWAFFFIEKFNNTLGNIHTLLSPYFFDRFYPESYILQAITFLKLCRYNQVVGSMQNFKARYSPVFRDLRSLLRRYRTNPVGFYREIDRYVKGRSLKYRNSVEIIRKVSTLDTYKVSRDTIRFSNRELTRLKRYRSKWRSSGLYVSAADFLKKKKSSAISNAGKILYNQTQNYYEQLLNLSNQTKLIVAEMQLGKIAKLRSKIKTTSKADKGQYIGGMQKLSLKDSLEYWPFEREYWEDELGYYVYNLSSQCSLKKN